VVVRFSWRRRLRSQRWWCRWQRRQLVGVVVVVAAAAVVVVLLVLVLVLVLVVPELPCGVVTKEMNHAHEHNALHIVLDFNQPERPPRHDHPKRTCMEPKTDGHRCGPPRHVNKLPEQR
jgi:hypothetical protein